MSCFIIEVATTSGPLCERFDSYEDALRRIEQIPAESLAGMPLIFQELPDGSQRLVRRDGKPLQWHRLPEDRASAPTEPLPMAQMAPCDVAIPQAPAHADDEAIPLFEPSPDKPLPPILFIEPEPNETSES